MMKHTTYILSLRFSVLLLVTLAVLPAGAQFYGSTDIVSLEAIYSEHKGVSSAVIARSTAEQATVLLHQWSRQSTDRYKEFADSLEKYHKTFELIDALTKSCATALNAYHSYDECSRYLQNIESSISRFLEDCALRGDVARSDSIIVVAFRDACNGFYEDGEELVKSLTDLFAYATGKLSCTTRDFMNTLNVVNDGMSSIRRRLQRADYIIYHYVLMRTGWFKQPLYAAKTLGEITEDSFGRWKQAAQRYGSYQTRRYTYD